MSCYVFQEPALKLTLQQVVQVLVEEYYEEKREMHRRPAHTSRPHRIMKKEILNDVDWENR